MKKMIFDQVEGAGEGGEYHDTEEMEKKADKDDAVMVKSKPKKKQPVSRKRTQSPVKRKQEEKKDEDGVNVFASVDDQ